MAVFTKSYPLGVSKGWNLKTYIKVTEGTFNSSGNYMPITVEMYIFGNRTGSYGYNGYATSTATLNVDGMSKSNSGFSWDFRGSTSSEFTLPLVTLTKNVSYSGGSGSVDISATLNLDYASEGVPVQNINDTITLTTMSTPDTFSIDSVSSGQSSATIRINKSNSTNTYQVRFLLPDSGTSSTVHAVDIGSGATSVPLNSTFWSGVYSRFPSSSYADIGVYLWTFSGGVRIAGETYSTMRIYMGSNPVISNFEKGVTIKETAPALVGKGVTDIFTNLSSIYFSLPNVSLSASSVLASYTLTVRNPNGVIHSSSTNNPIRDVKFSDPGEYTITASVTDSRSRTSVMTGKFTVVSYFYPGIYDLTRTRVATSTSTTPSATGTYVKLDFKVKGKAIGYSNYVLYNIKDLTTGRYLVGNGTDSWDTRATLSSGGVATVSVTVGPYGVNATNKIVINARDYLGFVDSMQFDVAFANIALSLGGDRGIAAGGLYSMSDANGRALQVFGSSHFMGNVTFDVPPSGINNQTVDLSPYLKTANLRTAIQAIDGSGSGIDADTLDGIHATQFALASDMVRIVEMSRATYNSLGYKNPNVIYVITS